MIIITVICLIIGFFAGTSQIKYMDEILPNTFPFDVYIINLDRKPERYKYMMNHLNSIGIYNYKKWTAVDGFKTDSKTLQEYGLTKELSERKGLAGCAVSHILLWRYIYENKLNWTLILEDDAHFHPNFM
jgi:GR25 family glycosyltransferase involved in LPS biosynthesis